MVLPIGMPILSPETFNSLQRALQIPDEDGELPSHFRWRLGWEELADAVADVHAKLEPAERRVTGVLAIGFPAAGALQHFGPQRNLPTAIGTHNSYWLWGPGETRGDVMLVVAPSGHPVLSGFAEVDQGTAIPCRYCGGGTRDEMIFVARRPILPLSELWAAWRDYR